MPIHKTHQVPAIGSKFIRRFKGTEYQLIVVETDRGAGYKVGRTTFKTPTAAAKSITGHAVNGWAFWKIKG